VAAKADVSQGAALLKPEAKKAHNDALANLQKGDYQKAYEGFLEALRLQGDPRIPKIVGNLGRAELKLGKYRDAAEHLASYLAEEKGLSAETRQEYGRLLDDAKAKVATLRVEVAQAGAVITVDGAAVGTAPLDRDLYVEPGRRKVEASLGERRAQKELDARAGGAVTVPLEPALPPKAPPPLPPAPPPPSASPVRTVLIVGGATLAAAAFATGVGLLVASGDKVGDSRKLMAGLPGKPGDPASIRCVGAYDTVCDQNRDILHQSDLLGNAGRAMLLVGGLVTLGTVGYAISNQRTKTTGMRVLPVAGAGSGGVLLQGEW
jgi:hypothetical protein